MLNARIALIARLLDLILTVIALFLSYPLRVSLGIGTPALPQVLEVPLELYICAGILWQLVFQWFGVYARLPQKFNTSWLLRLIQAHAVATLAFWGVLYVIYRDFSRLQTFYFAGVLFGLLIAARLLWDYVQPRLGKRRKRRVLIVGVNSYAYEISRIIRDYGAVGLQFVGFVPHEDEPTPPDADGVLGMFDELNTVIKTHAVDEVIICDKSHSRAYLRDLTENLTTLPVNVRLAPDYSELAYFRVFVEDFGGVPVISLRYDMLTGEQRLIKRAFDVVGAGLLLVLTLPLMLVIAVLIKLDSVGPVLFCQSRVGERGRLFQMYKFRTMVWDAESRITYTPDYKHADDPRVTRVGRWLRRTSLDEIPQFFNVLKGDMTLVGPRPELPQVVQLYSPYQRKRFEVPQGVTGWWQVNGRADVPMYEAVEYDVFYIRNYSIWLDLRILARTPFAIVQGRGAY